MVLSVLESVIGSSDVSDRIMKAIDECELHTLQCVQFMKITPCQQSS